MEKTIFNSKREALEEIFSILNIKNNWKSVKVKYTVFLDTISKESYSLKELGLSSQGQVDLTKSLFPDKNGNGKICFFLFQKFGLKHCACCKKVLERSEFHSNKSRADGLAIYCIPCFNVSVRDMRRAYTAKRKSDKIGATPPWADLLKIREFYEKCPEGYHVDHVIPLVNTNVCGLHTLDNLQYLLAKDNIVKSNKFTPA